MRKPCSVRSFFSLRSILKTVVKLDEQSCQLLSANSEVNFSHFQSFAQVSFSVSVGTTIIPGRNWKQWLLSEKKGEGANKIYSVTMFFHKRKKRRLHDRAEVQNFFSSVFIHFNTRREIFISPR